MDVYGPAQARYPFREQPRSKPSVSALAHHAYEHANADRHRQRK
jgi:hypothetical protein